MHKMTTFGTIIVIPGVKRVVYELKDFQQWLHADAGYERAMKILTIEFRIKDVNVFEVLETNQTAPQYWFGRWSQQVLPPCYEFFDKINYHL